MLELTLYEILETTSFEADCPHEQCNICEFISNSTDYEDIDGDRLYDFDNIDFPSLALLELLKRHCEAFPERDLEREFIKREWIMLLSCSLRWKKCFSEVDTIEARLQAQLAEECFTKSFSERKSNNA